MKKLRTFFRNVRGHLLGRRRKRGKRSRKTLLFRAVIICAIVIAGAYMRFGGLKDVSQTDEHEVVESAARVVSQKTLNPGFAAHPNHISIYLDALLFKTVSSIKFDQPFDQAFRSNKAFFYHLSRMLMATMGTLMVVVAYLIGRMFSFTTGALAAFLVAMLPSYIEHSHFSRPDIPLALFTILTIYFSMLYIKKGGKLWPLAAAAVSAGFSCSAKAPGLINLLTVLAIVPLMHYRDWRKLWFHLLNATFIFIAAILISIPSLVLYPDIWKTLNHISTKINGQNFNNGLGFVGNIEFYLSEYYRQTGMILSAFFLVGFASFHKQLRLIAPLLIGFVFLVIISKHNIFRPSWGFPIYLTPLLMSAIAMGDVLDGSWRRKMLRSFAVIMVVSGLFPITVKGMTSGLLFHITNNTMDAMASYLEEKGITKEQAAYEGYSPFHSWGYLAAFNYNPGRFPKGKQYVLLSSGIYDRFAPKGGYENMDWYRQILLFPKEKIVQSGCSKHLTTGLTFIDRSEFNKVIAMILYPESCLQGVTLQLYRVPPDRQEK